jgi:hypothetical protein
MSWCRAHSGTCDQILLPVWRLLSESWGLVSVGHPLWGEGGSTVCSAITQSSKSCRTRNHTLLSHLRLPQPGGPGSRIYVRQEQGGRVIPPSIGFPLLHLLWLAGLRWRYSNPPPTCTYIPQVQDDPVKSQSHLTTDSHWTSMSWCWVHTALEGFIWTSFNSTLRMVH